MERDRVSGSVVCHHGATCDGALMPDRTWIHRVHDGVTLVAASSVLSWSIAGSPPCRSGLWVGVFDRTIRLACAGLGALPRVGPTARPAHRERPLGSGAGSWTGNQGSSLPSPHDHRSPTTSRCSIAAQGQRVTRIWANRRLDICVASRRLQPN